MGAELPDGWKIDAASRVLSSLLYGVESTDPLALGVEPVAAVDRGHPDAGRQDNSPAW